MNSFGLYTRSYDHIKVISGESDASDTLYADHYYKYYYQFFFEMII